MAELGALSGVTGAVQPKLTFLARSPDRATSELVFSRQARFIWPTSGETVCAIGGVQLYVLITEHILTSRESNPVFEVLFRYTFRSV